MVYIAGITDKMTTDIVGRQRRVVCRGLYRVQTDRQTHALEIITTPLSGWSPVNNPNTDLITVYRMTVDQNRNIGYKFLDVAYITI